MNTYITLSAASSAMKLHSGRECPSLIAVPASKPELILAGLTCALNGCLPHVKIYNMPAAYTALLTISIYSLFIKRRIRKRFLPGRLWILCATWSVLHTLLFDSQELHRIFARNASALFSATLVYSICRRKKDIYWAVLGFASVTTFDAALGLGQFLNLDLAGPINSFFYSLQTEAVADHWQSIRSLHSNSVRIWGIHQTSHEFGYYQSLASYLFLAVTLVAKNTTTKTVFLTLFALTCMACFASGLRSGAWSLCIAAIAPIMTQKKDWKILCISLLCLTFFVGNTDFSKLISDANTSLFRLTEISNQSDSRRFESWQNAWHEIKASPYLGRTNAIDYSVYSARSGVSIHNGFLNGWYRYGLPWIILYFSAWTYTFFQIPRAYRLTVPQKIMFLCGCLMPLINSFFHTSIPTVNDLTFFFWMSMLMLVCAEHPSARFFAKSRDADAATRAIASD